MNNDSNNDLLKDLKYRARARQQFITKYMLLPILLGLIALGYTSYWFLKTRNIPDAPYNERLAFQAWSGLNSKDLYLAIARADECISTFEPLAKAEQQELTNIGREPPPVGTVTADQKQIILTRGPLNDVATCYFIKGSALEGLSKKDSAQEAFAKATEYPFARCWDPRGWFWSPAEASREHLDALRNR